VTVATFLKSLWQPKPDLTRWRHVEPPDASGEVTVWTVDFRQMKSFVRREDRGRAIVLADDAHHLRRGAAGTWEHKLLDEYFQLLVEQLTVTAADAEHPGAALAAHRLEQLGEGPRWERIAPTTGSPLEAAYRRFRASLPVAHR
jgi:hypothetical protein